MRITDLLDAKKYSFECTPCIGKCRSFEKKQEAPKAIRFICS